MTTQITVRDVDENVFQEFKSEAVRQGITMGTALTLAMEKFQVELKKKKEIKLWEPTSWGEGTKHLSEKMDDVLYGEKR